MRLNIFLVTCSFLFLAQTNSSFAQTTIIMEENGGVYSVPCTLNGLKLSFIFDTGASDVSISSTEALFMLKNGYLNSNDILGEQKYSNATGDISVGTIINLRKIEFAGLTLNNVRASVVHTLNAPLLLGQSALKQLGEYRIDGSKLTILNAPNKSYDSSTSATGNVKGEDCGRLESRKLRTNNQYGNIYSGTNCVYGNSPLLEEPDMQTSKIVGYAENNQVQIISRTNEKYYYVKSGSINGYLWAGWFKD